MVDDLVTCSRDAALALWRLLGSWGTQADRILYRGVLHEPLLLLLPEWSARPLAEVRWMARMIDASAAVAARGYAPAVDASLHLALRDPRLAGNDGRFVLSVEKGEGRLEPGGEGRMALGVGAFASLYTGWSDATTLALCGLLAGGSPEEQALLDAVFAGPPPSLCEDF